MKKHASSSKYRRINKKLLKMLKFLVLFNIFAIPLYIFLFLGIGIYPLQEATASAVSGILGATGVQNQLSGLDITVPTPDFTFTGTIDWDCTGWKSIMAFIALVLATEGSLKKKMMGMALVPLIYLINLGRVSFLFIYISKNGMENYQMLHSFLFGIFMIMAILGLWLVWLKYFNFNRLNKKVTIAKKKFKVT
jgi:exosortase/archaeosortase family protein